MTSVSARAIKSLLQVAGGIAAMILATALVGALPDSGASAALRTDASAASNEETVDAGSRAVDAEEPRPPPRPSGARLDDDASLAARADPVASYTLRAILDADTHSVSGAGKIVWRNASSKPVDELFFHLYLNAFKNDDTIFLRSRFGGGRSGSKTTQFGYVDVKKLVAPELDGADLWASAERHTPGDPNDETLIRVPLPSPIEPEQTLTLEIEFESQLPDIVERTGFRDSFHMVAQWFPKIARLEPNGKWAHFPFHAKSEFYADFGDYDVTIDVPSQMVVGATGARVEQSETGGRRVVRHRIADVHDFAWSAWDRFVEKNETIDGVDVRLLHPSGHENNAKVTLEALRAALPHMNRRYGKYPYPVLTVVHPPPTASNAGGMEYPTLITTGGRWYRSYLTRGVEAVTVHELGHQWFYGLVATNEHVWPFLDEGLNTYAEGLARRAKWGQGTLIDWPDFRVATEHVMRAVAAEVGHNDVVAMPAPRFATFSDYGGLVYGRTATIAQTLANVYGEDKLVRGLGRYMRGHRYRHPTPEDLLGALEETLGAEPVEVARRALFERGWVDFVAGDLQSVRRRDPAGVFDRDAGRETIERRADEPKDDFVGRMLVYRRGTLELPVEIELVNRAGERSTHHWDGKGRHHAVHYEGSSPLVQGVIDPRGLVALDQNLLNNAAGKKNGTPRTLERTTYVVELLLGLLGP